MKSSIRKASVSSIVALSLAMQVGSPLLTANAVSEVEGLEIENIIDENVLINQKKNEEFTIRLNLGVIPADRIKDSIHIENDIGVEFDLISAKIKDSSENELEGVPHTLKDGVITFELTEDNKSSWGEKELIIDINIKSNELSISEKKYINTFSLVVNDDVYFSNSAEINILESSIDSDESTEEKELEVYELNLTVKDEVVEDELVEDEVVEDEVVEDEVVEDEVVEDEVVEDEVDEDKVVEDELVEDEVVEDEVVEDKVIKDEVIKEEKVKDEKVKQEKEIKNELRNLKIDFLWDGESKEEVEIKLLRNGEVIKTLLFNSKNGLSQEVKDLDVYDENGRTIEYRVRLDLIEGYDIEILETVDGFLVVAMDKVNGSNAKGGLKHVEDVQTYDKGAIGYLSTIAISLGALVFLNKKKGKIKNSIK